MKRVLYVESNEDGTVGGSHKILFDLVTRVSADFQPVVLFYQENVFADRLRSRQVETVVWDEFRQAERESLRSGTKLSTAVALGRAVMTRRRFLLDSGIDLVHLANAPSVGLDDWLPASKLAKVPCVAYGMGDIRKRSNPIVRAALQSYDAYFPLSRFVEDSFIQNDIDPSLITLTYPGVDFDEIESRVYRNALDVRGEFELADDQLLVAMVGNVRTWKGQDVVLRALGGLERSELRLIKVLFVGDRGQHDAAYQRRLDALIHTHGLESAVEFTGRREDVPDLLEAADIAVHASVQPEPFGLVVQEAMAHGCATVAANKGGPVEMMKSGSGFMFDADEPSELTHHLRRLIKDSDLRTRVSENARRQARTFDVYDHVSLIESRYREILGLHRVRD